MRRARRRSPRARAGGRRPRTPWSSCPPGRGRHEGRRARPRPRAVGGFANPGGLNVILGQTHFIKTAEDVYEALVGSVPGIKFGVAFCEASGPCLVRVEGNDESLRALAAKNALAVGAGHFFVVFLKDAYPINVLRTLRDVPEIVTVYAATANPIDVVVAATRRGRGVLGVVDGERTKGLETEKDRAERMAFLRKIGYKLG